MRKTARKGTNGDRMDIKLSARMQMNVDMVTEKRVADIGCDHAFVSIYLVDKKIADHVYAMDVKPGPVEIARANVSGYGMEDRITVRLSDGFSMLGEDEADCAIIAGMGGPLMVNILKGGKKHTDNGIHLVLQPQSEINQVRLYLYEIGYEIIQENMTFDEGKYYTAMKAVPACKTVKEYSEEELIYGRCLLDNRNIILSEYLQKQITRNNELLMGLSHIHTDRTNNRIMELNHKNEIIMRALDYYKNI